MNVDIQGAKIYFTIPLLNGIPITETIVNTWIVMLIVAFICIFLTRKMKTRGSGKRQSIAEWIVLTFQHLVDDNMGIRYTKSSFPSFIVALFSLCLFGSLLSLFGMYPPTADLSMTLGLAIMIFVMITYTKIRTKHVGGYIKSFFEPIPFLMPLNVVSELSTPISMAFRLFGNIASGQVVMTLVYAALLLLSQFIFSVLPGILSSVFMHIPIFQIGIPAILSLYFDLFSSVMQSFIFCMLSMNYISAASESDTI